jgi:hypothetical protein
LFSSLSMVVPVSAAPQSCWVLVSSGGGHLPGGFPDRQYHKWLLLFLWCFRLCWRHSPPPLLLYQPPTSLCKLTYFISPPPPTPRDEVGFCMVSILSQYCSRSTSSCRAGLTSLHRALRQGSLHLLYTCPI